ncbi:hypothetical protein [Marinirhabdus gelatinilytica]|uniref:Glycerophosphoryl diester phosphodiesterase family protein n=1 Tax=Marinirhabdus gelatinilytica TaxID=1703343 RepID=A0A370QFK4_9FLAO|nr:hypothetical protein [Marinirhabdus gelatinilytica]RDK87145.1 hypothetical protein C8D94_102327 [Marinirhabdus gelatinilytica]
MTKGKLLKTAIILCLAVLGIWLYKYSPRKIEFMGYYDKIGAHRVNDLEKLGSALKYFDAIELDLVYQAETNILDVNHPPAPSIGLDFSEYMAALGTEHPFVWLDIKNLDSTNAEGVLKRLNLTVEKHNFPKEQILIETRFPEKLSLFSTEGYKTSYYLKQSLHKLKPSSLASEIEKIQKVLTDQPAVAISTEHFDYEILQQHFPKRTKYVWCLRHSKIGDFRIVRTLLKDESVALVLTRYNPF